MLKIWSWLWRYSDIATAQNVAVLSLLAEPVPPLEDLGPSQTQTIINTPRSKLMELESRINCRQLRILMKSLNRSRQFCKGPPVGSEARGRATVLQPISGSADHICKVSLIRRPVCTLNRHITASLGKRNERLLRCLLRAATSPASKPPSQNERLCV
jgi:hypothetical protein